MWHRAIKKWVTHRNQRLTLPQSLLCSTQSVERMFNTWFAVQYHLTTVMGTPKVRAQLENGISRQLFHGVPCQICPMQCVTIRWLCCPHCTLYFSEKGMQKAPKCRLCYFSTSIFSFKQGPIVIWSPCMHPEGRVRAWKSQQGRNLEVAFGVLYRETYGTCKCMFCRPLSSPFRYLWSPHQHVKTSTLSLKAH